MFFFSSSSFTNFFSFSTPSTDVFTFLTSFCVPTCRLWWWWHLHTRYSLCSSLLEIVCIKKKFPFEWREQREKEKKGRKKNTRNEICERNYSELCVFIMTQQNMKIYINQKCRSMRNVYVHGSVRARSYVWVWNVDVKCERINTQHTIQHRHQPHSNSSWRQPMAGAADGGNQKLKNNPKYISPATKEMHK